MRITCDIIRDLLPLYYDQVCSDDTKQLIEEHLSECDSCKRELEYMQGDFSKAVELEEEKIVKASSRTMKRIKVEHILIGILVSIILFLGYAFSHYIYESQIGTTLEKRQERLQEANHESVQIREEYMVNSELLLSIFDIYGGEESGMAFFEKEENGSFHFKSSMWSGRNGIKMDSFSDYLFFFLDQPNITHAEVTIVPEGGEAWTETYETTGIFWIERPDLKTHFSVELTYYDVDGNAYSW